MLTRFFCVGGSHEGNFISINYRGESNVHIPMRVNLKEFNDSPLGYSKENYRVVIGGGINLLVHNSVNDILYEERLGAFMIEKDFFQDLRAGAILKELNFAPMRIYCGDSYYTCIGYSSHFDIAKDGDIPLYKLEIEVLNYEAMEYKISAIPVNTNQIELPL